MDEEQANLAGRLAKNTNVAKFLLDKDKVWLGIGIMQNTLDDISCSKFLTHLQDLRVNTCNATPEQRVEIFVKIMLRK